MAGVNCTFLLNSGGSILLNDGTSVLQMNDISCSAGLANCKFLLNAGGNITLNAGGELQMNRDDCSAGPTPATGGTSGTGTRVRKRVGKQLISDNLGNRPTSVTSGESTARIIFKAKGLTKARWPILKSINESKCIKKPHQMGESVAKIIFKTVNESLSHIYFKHTMESFAIPHPSIQMGRQIRLSKLSMLKEVAQQIFSMDKPSTIRGFTFNEECHNEQLIAFTHSSSFIGNVRYDTDSLEMRILLNGKAYNFCNVSRRLFDAFEGASSKGAFFQREIRTLHDC